MQKRYSGKLTFAVDLCFAIFGVLLLTATLAGAEVYLTKGHMLADAEIANGCAPCGASMALVAQ